MSGQELPTSRSRKVIWTSPGPSCDHGTMNRILRWPSAVVLTVAVVVAGCDRVKKLAEGDDATKATTASADPSGLPQECVDYLEVLECASAKSDPASAKAQTDAARAGFKTLATSGGAAAAKKQCADLMAGSQVGFAQLGCTKAAAGAAAAAAKTVKPTPAIPTAKPAATPKATVAATIPSAAKLPPATSAPRPAGTAPTATAAAGKGRCPKGTLRVKGGGCDVPTCTTDDDCSTHACSLVREGVRACSGSLDIIDDSEFQ